MFSNALPPSNLKLPMGGPSCRLHLSYLGDVQRLTLGIASTSGVAEPGPSWHVAVAQVEEEATGRRWHFEGGFGSCRIDEAKVLR
jgi:hypothetical protein